MVKFKAEAFSNESLLLLAGVCMAKILIVYDSKTGNTEKMAFAVAEGAKQVEGIEVVVKRVEKQALKTCWLLMESSWALQHIMGRCPLNLRR
jgi:multimeric flavodoxin WrbA